MHITPLRPSLAAGELRARQDADPSLEGEMLRAAKRSQEVYTPIGVELIERTGAHEPDPPPAGQLGQQIDTYA